MYQICCNIIIYLPHIITDAFSENDPLYPLLTIYPYTPASCNRRRGPLGSSQTMPRNPSMSPRTPRAVP